MLDETASRVLTVCARSGLFQMLRMPFGPAPAPPEMQSYVVKKFGELRDPETGEKICVRLMDDLTISSATFTDTAFMNNTAAFGAGLRILASEPSFTRCNISANRASNPGFGGGGAYIFKGGSPTSGHGGGPTSGHEGWHQRRGAGRAAPAETPKQTRELSRGEQKARSLIMSAKERKEYL